MCNGFNKLQLAYAANPQLSALGVYFDPDFVWQKIVEYLSQLKSEAEPRPEPIADDLKIASKGFDNKRSFRPKMKTENRANPMCNLSPTAV